LELITGGSGEALVNASKLASEGDNIAMFLLGENAMPSFGQTSTPWGSPPSGGESLKWFQESAKAGNPWAGYWAAGLGLRAVQPNKEQAKRILEKSVKDGSPCMAQYGLGILAWQEGDLEAAMNWFMQVAEFSPAKSPIKNYYIPRQSSDQTALKRDGIQATTYKGLPVWEQDAWLRCDAWVFAAMYNVAALHVEHKKDIRSYIEWMNRIYLDPRARDLTGNNATMMGQFTKADQKDYKEARRHFHFGAPTDLWAFIAFMASDSVARTAAISLTDYYNAHTNQKDKNRAG